MVTCFKCGAKTGLYYLDVPICPICSAIEDAERNPCETGFIELIRTTTVPEGLKAGQRVHLGIG
jgi:hypothetical protein